MKPAWLFLAMLFTAASVRAFGPEAANPEAPAPSASASDTPTLALNATLWKAPANETRVFAAARVGKAGASETMAELKQLYAAAAAEYRLVNGELTEWNTEAQAKYAAPATDGIIEKLLGQTTLPPDIALLTWEKFGVLLKAGRVIPVRIVESRLATPELTTSHESAYQSHSLTAGGGLGEPAREPWIIDYTVTWLPAKN